jgi:hypothetical protein
MTTMSPSVGDVGAACAVITRDYLASARVLAESFLAHHPGRRFYLLVLGDLPAGVDPGAGIRTVDVSELDCPWFWEMAVRYDALQLSCAVKPYLVATLFERFGESRVFYFDADIQVLRRLGEAERLLETTDLVLTPHILQPIEPDGRQPDELYILSGGVHNMGFFAIRDSAESRRFLRWWSSRLRAGGGIDLAAGMFLDQRWADLVPALFPSTALLRDPTYNVAFWNLQERPLVASPDGLRTDGRPIAFLHFSGLDLDAGAFRETHQTRILAEKGSPLAAAIERYVSLIEAHGHAACRAWGNGLGLFDNGIVFHPLMRRLYLELPEARRLRFGNPFSTESPESFYAWAVRPDPVLSPLARVVYDAVPDAAARYPDVTRSGLQPFLQWARTEGARTLGLDPVLLDAPDHAAASGAEDGQASRSYSAS